MAVSQRDRLRQLGQANLGAWIEAASGYELWSIQHEVLTELSVVRAQVVVPSCNASGKTFLAARAALAFYDAYTPGAPCLACDPDGTKGGCRGSKVLTTSSKESHLKDNLWGEIRLAIAMMARKGVTLPGELAPADTFLLDSWGDHFIRGQVATKEEGFQGYHAAHKLIIGDEATAVSTEVSRGITSLQATADTRLLLIFNPTTTDTYAAAMARSPASKVVKITAFDTPHFTGEHVPEGSNLVTPAFLDTLQANGMGPGSYEWTTRVQAEFWGAGEDLLIPPGWVEAAKRREPFAIGQVGMGIDLAPYGTSESAIGVRRGDRLVDMTAYPSGRVDFFVNGDPEKPADAPPWYGAVRKKVVEYAPWVIVYDADGVGAGALGDFMRLHEWAIKNRHMLPDSRIIPFRGGKMINDHYTNARGAWWWQLRKRYERGGISQAVRDPKLDAQLSQMTYKYTNDGKIRVETKDEMRRRGFDSPDRADTVMYTYAYSEELSNPDMEPGVPWVVAAGYAQDRSEAAMWDRGLNPKKHARGEINAVTGLPDEL